ncbi:MAG: 50S ribosomal protein L10 [Mycoplasma sp.]
MKQVIKQKADDVSALASDLQTAKTIVAFEYHGASTKAIASLRRNLHQANAKMYVAKNNIFNRAFASANITQFGELKGPNALIVAQGDEIVPFKELHNLMKKYKQVVYKQGIINQTVVNADQVSALANIPGREGLYSMLLSCLVAPIRNLAYGIKSVGESKPQ